MTPPLSERINLKNPWLAAFLGFLLPGLGHLYQGRWLKGVLFSVCILGTFYCGVSLGDGRTIYTHYYTQPPNPGNREQKRIPVRNYGYFLQVMVGLPAMPAIYQSRRYNSQANTPIQLPPEGLTMPFDGHVLLYKNNQQLPESRTITGTLQLGVSDQQGENNTHDEFKFVGTVEGIEKPVEFILNDNLHRVGSAVYARPRWRFEAAVLTGMESIGAEQAEIKGDGKSRGWLSWYQVPLEDETIQELNGWLGKQWDMAMVFTWVAGLLNLLAIWDAFEGPAYGYGDEKKPETTPEDGTNKKEEPPKPVPVG